MLFLIIASGVFVVAVIVISIITAPTGSELLNEAEEKLDHERIRNSMR